MLSFVSCFPFLAGALFVPQDEAYLGAPIHYGSPALEGPVERLARSIRDGQVELSTEPGTGYLTDLLAALDIPASSQMLVFSKTSFQAPRISPRNPRALYFGDDVYVGWVPGSALLEITSVDPARGPVFYTLTPVQGEAPRFVRRDEDCLGCHASSRTRNWPGNLVRSVHADAQGNPIVRSGSHLVGHETPLEQRWGGWYVTGTHGDQRHMGNVPASADTGRVDLEAGANVVDLGEHIDTSVYLSPHSDLVALMVFEHQGQMHNRLSRASYEVRLALYRQLESNRFFGEPLESIGASAQRILERKAQEIVEYLLFRDEVRLADPVRGTSAFAAEFQAGGRKDSRGRSLKDLDLEQRLFRYPCSYLIYTAAFDALPARLLEIVYAKLWTILNDAPAFDGYVHLSLGTRRAIKEILLETKSGLPRSWR